MVTKKNNSSLGYPRQPSTKASENFINQAFVNSLTIHPLDADSIPEKYSPALIFLFIISMAVTSVFMITKILKDPSIGENLPSILVQIVLILLLVFVFYSLICYVFSFAGSLILGISHTPKQYSINASSFTYILISFILTPLMPASLSRIPELAAWFLMSYYIGLNYRPYYDPNDERTSTIHTIYIHVGYLAASFTCFMIPYQVDGIIKNMI